MYVKVEPSGCDIVQGLVQIRFAMYLDPNDYGYDIQHIQVPVFPLEPYRGKDKDYQAWSDTFPKVWINGDFHNHFIYVEPEITDKVIMDIGEAYLQEAYIKWIAGEKLDLKSPSIEFPTVFDKAKIEAKVQHLKDTTLERVI